MTDIRNALSGEEIPVDFSLIERSLAELWKNDERDHAVTKAALWNVVAHSTSEDDKNSAREVLASVSESVPQRTILVTARHDHDDAIHAWISANCHLGGGGGSKVCSEEITIVAGGARIQHVPPIVNALLIPDMPVATWWLGDLPNGRNEYLDALLDPADRLIVDSAAFDSPGDLEFVQHLALETSTRPADLNWSRVEEWRMAAASMFDVPEIRSKMGSIQRVRITYGSAGSLFGEEIEARLFASWLLSRTGHALGDDGIFLSGGSTRVEVRFQPESGVRGLLQLVAIEFSDGSVVTLARHDDAGAIRSEASGLRHAPVTITRMPARGTDGLITRELGRAGTDRVYIDVLPLAVKLAR